ncbi:MAG: GTP 3',8-cyclase MoaA [Candidatus Hadarchaeales archaeon]
MLRDSYGREVTGLRLSVSSRCNLRCFYCHMEGQREGAREMTPGEIGGIARIAAELGVRSVKITGGEPLIREDIGEIVGEISRAGIRDISMTTNGVLLAENAASLRKEGLCRVNVSLDTLDPELYWRITGERALPDVLAGIEAAKEAGLSPIKINMVLLSGLNEGGVDEMMKYAFGMGAILQIIEYVPARGRSGLSVRSDLADVERMLEGRAVGVFVRPEMQMRRRYVLQGGEVEVVRPMHNSEFCMHCTRLRVTSDGRLKPCLMREDGAVDLVSYIRAGDRKGAREAFLRAVVARRPFWAGR